MADAIVRLKVESQEYDQKLQRATQQLQHMEKEVRRTDATFAYADKEEIAFIQSLGSMETKADSAKGKIAEMTKSFTELSLQYNRLTKEEKASPFGKALASSLDQLKTRIKDSKSELSDVEGRLTGVGESFKQLGNKMGIPMDIFTKFGPILAAAGVAAKVAKDAFNANEAAVDDWGRTVEAARSIYDGFLTALNTGDFSGFLSRIGSISEAARKAYDELDRLGTMKTIQSPEMSRQQTENERNRMMIQTRRYIAPLDGSAGMAGMSSGDLLSDAQIKQIEADLQNGIQRIVDLVTNEVQQTTNAIEAEYNRQAQTLGMGIDDFKKGTSSMAEFDKMIELAKKYYEYEKAHTTTPTTYSPYAVAKPVRDNTVNPYEQFKGWDVFRVDGEAYNKLVKLIQQRDQQMGQAYSTQSQAYRTVNRAEGISASGKTRETPQDKAEEKVAKALEDYATTMNLAAIRKEAGLDDEEKYKDNELSAHEKLFDAYTDAYNLYADPKYKEAFDKEAAEVLDLARVVKELKDEKEKQKQADQELKRAELEAARQMKQLDTRILGGLTSTAKKVGWTAADLGATGIKTKINAGIDITEDEWTALQDKLNERLQSLGLDPIQIDFETGNIETVINETKRQFEEMMDSFSSGVGAISTIGNAFNDLKGIGEDLSEAFSGEMDAWDALMTVFNSGIGIMQTVIGVMEAINTLQELGNALSDAKVAKQAAETTAVVSGKGAEAAAESAEAAASGTATAANTAEAAAGAGKAMAGIPIVGPVLAIAAIAAVLAAVLAATSKAKSAGNFSTGGIVPGNSYSGDNLSIGVNSQELVLNRAQTSNLASQLNSNPMSNLALSMNLKGEDIQICLDNNNRRRGR